MSVRKLKPITPGQRWKVANTFEGVDKVKPEKTLTVGKSKSAGRNHKGRMTVRHRGGGHKQKYRIIDFKRNRDGEAVIDSIQYDPNRTAFIALVVYGDGEKRYVIAQKGMKKGQTIEAGDNAAPNVGNTLKLKNVPLGTVVSCIELKPGQGARMARSAGSHAQVISKEGKFVNVKLPSGEIRMILNECKATVGVVSNSDHQLEVSGKAGRSRWKGRRPRTRSMAMNPVDHPMGGGEGRASGGIPRSKNGIPAKGYKTRKPKKASSRYIVEKRKK